LSRILDRVAHNKAPDNHREHEIALQFRLYQLQVAYHRQGLNAIIVLEGWDAAGKGGLIKRLTAELDPRFVAVEPIAAPDAIERTRHYMARFWDRLPAKGNWTVFDRSWYGRVLVERVEGFASKAEWSRAYAEINAMEHAQVANGTRIIKLFLHISQAEQDERLINRLEAPWKRWKVGPDDFRNRSRRDAYLEAYEDMFAQCDTPHARWHIIGANHKQQARLEGLKIIADELAKAVDLTDPPLDPALRELAEKELGVSLDPK